MQKAASYMIICALFFVVCIAGCGSGSSTSAEETFSRLPGSPVSVEAGSRTLMGGSIQGTPLDFHNFSVVTVANLAGTVGQNGFSNYSTSNGPPATFNQPNDITTDGNDFYVADYGNGLVRRIYKDAGSDEVKTSTLHCIDSNSGSTVFFSNPSGITTDGTYLYVADSGYNSIRVITIATDEAGKHRVTTIGSANGYAGSVDSLDSTKAADVRFNRPTGITTNGVNLYVTDFNNATVRQIEIENGSFKSVTTLAGLSGTVGTADGKQGAARFNRPGRITTDGSSLFLTDFYNRTIRKINILTGEVTTIAGSPGPLGADNGAADGSGTAARFNQPNGITTDGTFLYVTDSYLNSIRKIAIASGEVTTVPLPANSLHTPIGITTDGHALFVVDTATLSFDNTYSYSNSILSIK